MAKAGRPRKGSAGLPGWFDIRKYAVARDFGALQWYQQLGVRNFINNWTFEEEISVDLGDEWQELITSDPIVTTQALSRYYLQNAYNSGLAVDYLFDTMSLDAWIKHGVAPMTNGQVQSIYRQLPAEVLDHHVGAPDGYTPLQRAPFKCFPRFTGIYGEFVCVDMSLPDAILIEEFKDYLRSQREDPAEAHAAYLRGPDFRDWYNMGLLPYLDLKLLERATGETFLWSAFADALNLIVDDPIGSESTLQKNLKKCVARIDYKLIRILKAQAIKEQSGKRKKSGKLSLR